MPKMPTVNPLFLTSNYICNKFFIKKWFNRVHFLIDEKNVQKLALTDEPISVHSYYIIIPSFQSQFLVS